LKPGQYHGYLRGPAGSTGFARFEIAADKKSEVRLLDPASTIRGKVSYNGEFGGNVRVTGSGPSLPGSSAVSTIVSEDGSLNLAFDEPGRYAIVLNGSDGSRIAQNLTVNITFGENPVTWDLVGGSIQLELVNVDRKQATRISIQRTDVSIEAMLLPGVSTFRRTGLPYGTYRVSATQVGSPPRVASHVVDVDLNDRTSNVTVPIEMTFNESQIVALSPEGATVQDLEISVYLPIGGLRARGAGTQNPLAAKSLAAYPPGTRVQLRPPSEFVPVCRIVPSSGILRVHLQRGQRTEIRFDRGSLPAISPLFGTVEGIAGSECGVPLSAFSSELVSNLEGSSRFAVKNFPTVDKLRFETVVPQRTVQPIILTNGVVNLRLPTGR
jgi:hypothetical protein